MSQSSIQFSVTSHATLGVQLWFYFAENYLFSLATLRTKGEVLARNHVYWLTVFVKL